MADQGAVKFGRVPTRVLLHGEPDGWRYTVIDQHGDEQSLPLGGPGVHWQPPGRKNRDPEPPWWGRRLEETAEALRDHIGRALTDQAFIELGAEARIAWFAVEEPITWEGLVTLGEPDPARFPGKVPPFVVTLEPGRGALLPDAHLFFSTVASDAWTTLAAVSERCGTAPPRASFLCGYTDHRSVHIGRGSLNVSTLRGEDGTERIAEIYGHRGEGWGGNPELRLRLDGIDLLNEPADDVVALFRDLGHEVLPKGHYGFHIPAMGLALHRPDTPRDHTSDRRRSRSGLAAPRPEGPHGRFSGASLGLPTALASWYLNR
ncbi:hypothetical protein GCM10010191_92920 [Actinomadura vinacea]|uniref:Uncharacterized protein n=1 Tax=Actinomadura vinacea TaxID=115336 RepID=A0ABN3KGC0_9ACTN